MKTPKGHFEINWLLQVESDMTLFWSRLMCNVMAFRCKSEKWENLRFYIAPIFWLNTELCMYSFHKRKIFWVDVLKMGLKVIVSPKMPTTNLKDFCPGILLEGRSEILQIFGWYFGRNDDLILNSEFNWFLIITCCLWCCTRLWSEVPV